MRARAVIGASFGDEGKGLVTDYLCSQGAGMVVRYNGGAQAGHTVVTPEGDRHVFSHIGSGSFLGVPTFLSQFFVCNPILFAKEITKLKQLGIEPTVYAHPNCLVTTFADMMINQTIEDARGNSRHGSCGVGFAETIARSELPELKITLSDLWNGASIEDRLIAACTSYAEFRCGKQVENADSLISHFVDLCAAFAEAINPLGIDQCEDPVFEGAQGLLLSQDNKNYFPHLTRSFTGMHNVRILCQQAGIDEIEPYYVSRTYLTRHGAGHLPAEDKSMSYPDETNQPNSWQGTLRFAPLDAELRDRCSKDAGMGYKLVLTHCDQVREPFDADLYFDGPTREHARTSSYKKAA
jgi:adenylosuccinate synthase